MSVSPPFGTLQLRPPRSCSVCGCTDDRACPGGCAWVADDLCSACEDFALHNPLPAGEWEFGDDDQDAGEQPACALCLGPAGPCPLRVWRTADADAREEVFDEWAVCWPCVEKSGKPLEQLMVELAAGPAVRGRDVP